MADSQDSLLPKGYRNQVVAPYAKQTPEFKRIDKLFNQQYLHSGFCGDCGEGIEPYVKGGDEALFGKCEYNGSHPRCSGEHKMEFEGKTPETFGSYEIYRCVNPGCDYAESY